MLRKQGTAVDLTIFSEEEFQEILESLKRFKSQCNEPNKLSVPFEGKHFKKSKPQTSKSIHGKFNSGERRNCNLRRFRSFDSLSGLGDTIEEEEQVQVSGNHLCSTQDLGDTAAGGVSRDLGDTAAGGVRRSSGVKKNNTEESFVCSSFNEDFARLEDLEQPGIADKVSSE